MGDSRSTPLWTSANTKAIFTSRYPRWKPKWTCKAHNRYYSLMVRCKHHLINILHSKALAGRFFSNQNKRWDLRTGYKLKETAQRPACGGRRHGQIAQTTLFHMSCVFKGKHNRLKALVLTDQVPNTVRYMLRVSSSPTMAMLSIFLDSSGPVSHRHFSPGRMLPPIPAFPRTSGVSLYWIVPSSPSLSSFS